MTKKGIDCPFCNGWANYLGEEKKGINYKCQNCKQMFRIEKKNVK